MKAVVLAVGDEILDGRVPDENSAWLAGRLHELGIECCLHLVVGDSVEGIRLALDSAFDLAERVLVTGGLGPTEDDRTREAVAGFAGVGLLEDREAWGEIRKFFEKKGLEANPSNRRQALLPEGAGRHSNRIGTAPGFSLEIPGKGWIHALPGVPSEARRMFEEGVRPELEGLGTGIVCRTLCFSGVSESRLGGLCSDWLKEGGEVRVGMTAEYGLIKVRAQAEGEGAGDLVAHALEAIRTAGERWFLGEGDREIEDFLVGRLGAKDMSLAVAESCTAGFVAARLGSVPGASKVFREGIVAYADEAKTRLLGVPPGLLAGQGAVSEACARAMAEGLLRSSGVRLAGAVTGVAGPSGGSPEKPVGLVHFAVCLDGATRALSRRYGNPGRQQVRERAARELLSLLLEAVR